jgi:hypothetical protein
VVKNSKQSISNVPRDLRSSEKKSRKNVHEEHKHPVQEKTPANDWQFEKDCFWENEYT